MEKTNDNYPIAITRPINYTWIINQRILQCTSERGINMTQFKDMKIRIKDSEHSRAVQDCLFQLGFVWQGDREGEYWGHGTHILFFLTRKEGLIYHADNDENYFNSSKNEEVTLEQLQAMVAGQSAAENVPEDKFMPENTISTYMCQLQDLCKNAKVSVTVYGDEFHVCNMDNDDEVVVKDWGSVLEAIKVKQNYLSFFGR